MTADFAARYGPWALIAGASDGVGAAFAEALAQRGLDVVLLARRQAALDQVAAGIAESRVKLQKPVQAEANLAGEDPAARRVEVTIK